MFIERKSLRVKSEAFIHSQGWHPLRNIPVNEEWQAEEIGNLFFVVEVELNDVHKNVGRDGIPPYVSLH